MTSLDDINLKVDKLEIKIEEIKKLINPYERTFGIRVLKESQPISYLKDIEGVGSVSKKYIFSIRAIPNWKGRKNDLVIMIRQQEREPLSDKRVIGIRIPLNDTKKINQFVKHFLSILYISCEVNLLDINEILKENLNEINKDKEKMVEETKEKLERYND